MSGFDPMTGQPLGGGGFDPMTGQPIAPGPTLVQPAAVTPGIVNEAEPFIAPVFGSVRKVIIGKGEDCCQPRHKITIYDKAMEIVKPACCCFPPCFLTVFEERKMIMRHRFTGGAPRPRPRTQAPRPP